MVGEEMININDNYAEALITEIRDQKSGAEVLRDRLYLLGQKVGQVIAGNILVQRENVMTPMGYQYSGMVLLKKRIVVISTKDDYSYFAKGICSTIKEPIRGYMDFEGKRGKEALSHPIRSIEMPLLEKGTSVECLIVAKSVLATGCTAISLTKKAMELCNPRHVIIATVFYTEQGAQDILSNIANAEIYAFGKPDGIDQNGMLTPGVGNLDLRLWA